MGIHAQPREIDVPKNDPFKNDLLDRREAVDTLTHLVANVDGPCVLAVDAAWGAGKTTFLRIWTQHLRNESFSVVEFNAWETDYSEEPFVTLSTELTEGLRLGKTTVPGDTAEDLKRASLEVLRWVIPRAMRFAVSHVPVVGVEAGEMAASFAEERLSRYSEARTSVKGFRSVLQNMARALSDANENLPLIVAIDELDRCRPSYAIELLEVAKHLFSVDRVVFVLAVNCEQLAHSVKALYGNDFDAEGYLRRFFDVDCQLPEPSRDAFIRAQLQATGIDEYSDCSPATKSFFATTYFQRELKREKVGETMREMLLTFFRASDVSFRTIGQAIHRLGLLYASLRADQEDYGVATTVALILRTFDRKLYSRFVTGEISDLEVLEAFFNRPSLAPLRQEEWSIVFEATVILAALEEDIPNISPTDTVRSPLLDWYRDRGKSLHGSRVLSAVEGAIADGNVEVGFIQAVRRLELVSATLIEKGRTSPPQDTELGRYAPRS